MGCHILVLRPVGATHPSLMQAPEYLIRNRIPPAAILRMFLHNTGDFDTYRPASFADDVPSHSFAAATSAATPTPRVGSITGA